MIVIFCLKTKYFTKKKAVLINNKQKRADISINELTALIEVV